LHAIKSTEKVWAQLLEENHSKKPQTSLFGNEVSVFLENLSILLTILFHIFQNVSVYVVKP